LTTKEFEQHVKDKARYKMDMVYCTIALNEEAGEVAGWYKKFVLRGNPVGNLTHDDLKGELGDVLYYLTAIAINYGWTLEEVMQFNKEKLDARAAKGLRQIV
jgi:NTP pyrophosphatase (non-canonical NTP hydrolase)